MEKRIDIVNAKPNTTDVDGPDKQAGEIFMPGWVMDDVLRTKLRGRVKDGTEKQIP